MSNFEEIKSNLNEQWLDYYEANQSWISSALPKNSNGYLEQKILCYFILGVISALEPKLKDILKPFSELNQQPQDLIRVLGIETLQLDEKIQVRQLARENADNHNKLASGLNRDQEGNIIDPEYEIASKHLDEIRKQIKRENPS